MQQNQPIVIISAGVCAYVALHIGRLFLFLVANGDPSGASIVIILSIILAGGIFVFFNLLLRDGSQSGTNYIRTQYPQPVSAEPTARAGTKTRTVVEVMSAIAVILTTAGLVVCIVVPSSIVGPILSLNVILWAILYRWMKNNNY